MASEPLSNFPALYPKAKDEVTRQLNKDLQNISDNDFRTAKDRIALFMNLAPLLQKNNVNPDKQISILEAVLEGGVERAKATTEWNDEDSSRRRSLLLSTTPSFNPTLWAPLLLAGVRKTFLGKDDIRGVMDDLFREATEAAMQISDSQFLNQLEQHVERHAQRIPQFKVWVESAKRNAFEHLEVSVARAVHRLVPVLHRIQVEECTAQIKRESVKRAEEELHMLRMNLIKNVNHLSTQTAYSCVCNPFVIVDHNPTLTLFLDIHYQSMMWRKFEEIGGILQDRIGSGVRKGRNKTQWPYTRYI